MTPDEHAAATTAEIERAETLAIEAQVAGYRAALHATLGTKAGTGGAYETLVGASGSRSESC